MLHKQHLNSIPSPFYFPKKKKNPSDSIIRLVSPHLKFKSSKLHFSPACVEINTHLPLCMCPYVFLNVLLHHTQTQHSWRYAPCWSTPIQAACVKVLKSTDNKTQTTNDTQRAQAFLMHKKRRPKRITHKYTTRVDKIVKERECEWHEKIKVLFFFRCSFVYCCCALFRSSDSVEDDSVCML